MLRAVGIFVFVTACAVADYQQSPPSIASATGEETVASEVLNLPLLPGSMPCGEVDTFFDSSPKTSSVACIQYRFDDPQASEIDWKYVAELEKLGWEFNGGAAFVYYLKRPIDDDGCYEELSFVNWVYGDPDEVAKIGTNDEQNVDWSKIPYGLILLYLSDVPVCDEVN